MPQPFIVPPDNREPAANEQSEQAARLPMNAHPSVMARHGARVLDPDTAMAADGWPAPQSTVYRARTLLLPPDLQEEQALGALNEVLADSGMRLQPSSAAHGADAGAGGYSVQPHHTAVVLPVSHGGQAAGGADAWAALTTLRAAARDGGRLDGSDVGRISLEHLLVGAAIAGSPGHRLRPGHRVRPRDRVRPRHRLRRGG